MAKLYEVMFRIDRELWNEAKRVAAEDGISVAEYVRGLIRRSVAQRPAK